MSCLGSGGGGGGADGASSRCRKRDKLKAMFGFKGKQPHTALPYPIVKPILPKHRDAMDTSGIDLSMMDSSMMDDHDEGQATNATMNASKAQEPSHTETVLGDPNRIDYNQTGVMELIDRNFRTFVSEQDVTLVLFYSTSGEESTVATSRIQQGSEITDRPFSAFAKVDCNKNYDLCEEEKVTTLPSFKLFSKGYVVGTVKDFTTLGPKNMKAFVENCPLLDQAGRPVPKSYTLSGCERH